MSLLIHSVTDVPATFNWKTMTKPQKQSNRPRSMTPVALRPSFSSSSLPCFSTRKKKVNHWLWTIVIRPTPSCHITGNFRGFQFSRIDDLYHFMGLTFADHAHYILYNCAYFMGLIFTVSQSSTKIGPLKNFPLYGIQHRLLAKWASLGDKADKEYKPHT